MILWPNHARRSLREGLADAIVNLSALYQALISSNSLDTLNARVSDVFRKNATLLDNALHEAYGPMRERESLALMAVQVGRIRDALETLKLAVRDGAADAYFRRSDAELERVHAAVVAAFGSLANSMRTGKPQLEWPELTPAISALEEKAALTRKSGLTATYPLDEILRFYSLLLGSRILAQELELARGLVASKIAPK